MPGSEALTKSLQDGLAKFFHFYSRLDTEELVNDEETEENTNSKREKTQEFNKVDQRDLEDEDVVIFDRTWYVTRPSGRRDGDVDPLVMTLRPAGQTDVTRTLRHLRGLVTCCPLLGWITTVSVKRLTKATANLPCPVYLSAERA
ncbi:PREDICTED: uncharacterized protein LOC109468043 [Branchiostoma belcheri]|uniref:Uncharacterized protein LOC109468043 n=1 Tax=Branchiostoma belcheri TaxID=7741 RepID=A0A6P4YTC1_BRABE|nr:PREDICTED: uncharacterized protein LOC109468043 [Branchiostoma belcheri]